MTGSQRRTSAHLSLGPGGGCCRSPGHRAHPAPAARAARLALAISWLRGEGPHGAGPGAGRGAAKWVGPGMERLARAGGLHGGGGAARRLAAGARGKAEATHTPHGLKWIVGMRQTSCMGSASTKQEFFLSQPAPSRFSLTGQPWWLSGLALPSTQGVILETWDGVPRRAPCMKPASPSACVSASLSLSECVSLMNK